MKLTRREFIKTNAIAAAATTAGMSVPGVVQAAMPQSEDGVRWDKGVCRYCGTVAACWSASRTAAWSPPRATRMPR
jgi:anaerobic selenocysteine-containing dehydrogenase